MANSEYVPPKIDSEKGSEIAPQGAAVPFAVAPIVVAGVVLAAGAVIIVGAVSVALGGGNAVVLANATWVVNDE